MTATLQLLTAQDVFASPAYADAASAGAGMTAEKRAFVEFCCKAVSEEAEAVTGRWFKLNTYTETLDVKPMSRLLKLRGYPLDLTVAFDVREEATGNWGATTPIPTSELAAIAGGENGQIELRSTQFCGGPQTVRVVYKGGLAADSDTVPDRLKLACVEQVIYIVKRAPNLHLESTSEEGGSSTYYRSSPLLDSVKRVFLSYRKVV